MTEEVNASGRWYQETISRAKVLPDESEDRAMTCHAFAVDAPGYDRQGGQREGETT